MRNSALAPVIAGILLAAAGSARAAQTATTTFQVTATVQSNCLVSATDLNFGSFTASADVSGTSSVDVNCTNGTPYTIKLNPGFGSFATRTMRDSSNNALAYNLYTTAARDTVWGDGTSSTGTIADTGAGLAVQQPHTVYGLLPKTGNENAPVGSYADTITVTVEY